MPRYWNLEEDRETSWQWHQYFSSFSSLLYRPGKSQKLERMPWQVSLVLKALEAESSAEQVAGVEESVVALEAVGSGLLMLWQSSRWVMLSAWFSGVFLCVCESSNPFQWISYGFHMDFIGPAILWFLWSTRSFQQVTTWGRSTKAWRDPDPHRLFSLSAASLCCFDALPRELCQYLDLPCKIGHQFGLSSTDQWVSSWEAESSVCLDSSGSEQRHRCLIAWIHLYSTVFIVFSIFLAISVTSCCGCKMLKQEITKHFEHLWTNCVKRCEELKLPRFEVMSTSISVATSQTRSCKSYQFLVFVMSFFTKLFEIIRSHLHFIFFPSVRSFQGRLAHRR